MSGKKSKVFWHNHLRFQSTRSHQLCHKDELPLFDTVLKTIQGSQGQDSEKLVPTDFAGIKFSAHAHSSHNSS
jgi:hypothetical protein